MKKKKKKKDIEWEDYYARRVSEQVLRIKEHYGFSVAEAIKIVRIAERKRTSKYTTWGAD